MQLFLQNVQKEVFRIFKMFKNDMKFTRTPCCFNEKKPTETKTPYPLYSYFTTIVGNYNGVIIEGL